MSECRCFTPPFDFREFISSPLGTDMTNHRYGEVSLKTCRTCGTRWLHYLVEYEGVTASGRWYRGLISEEELAALAPEHAVPFLEALPWHFCGGSYFRSQGHRSTGAIRVDL